jgi:hypothetical protein
MTLGKLIIPVLVVFATLGCGQQSTTVSENAAVAPPVVVGQASPPVDATKFDSLYRSLKAIEGATTVGVNLMKFRDLIQDAATEVLITKDKALNASELKVHAQFVEGLAAYQYSAQLWQLKNQASEEQWKGEIPVLFEGVDDPTMEAMVVKYSLATTDRVLPLIDKKYKSVPAETPQLLWQKAATLVDAGVRTMRGDAPHGS